MYWNLFSYSNGHDLIFKNYHVLRIFYTYFQFNYSSWRINLDLIKHYKQFIVCCLDPNPDSDPNSKPEPEPKTWNKRISSTPRRGRRGEEAKNSWMRTNPQRRHQRRPPPSLHHRPPPRWPCRRRRRRRRLLRLKPHPRPPLRPPKSRLHPPAPPPPPPYRPNRSKHSSLRRGLQSPLLGPRALSPTSRPTYQPPPLPLLLLLRSSGAGWQLEFLPTIRDPISQARPFSTHLQPSVSPTLAFIAPTSPPCQMPR